MSCQNQSSNIIQTLIQLLCPQMSPKCTPCFPLHKRNSDEECPLWETPEPVYLNVYDIYKLNDFTSNFGLGVFHSGVEIYGKEFGYGGHPYPQSGIFEMEPEDVISLETYFNMKRGQITLKKKVLIGGTRLTRTEIERIINKMSRRFGGNKYHLITNNCNHFSQAFVKLLCKKNIPKWVNRLANVGSCIPFLERILPHELLGPGAY